MSVSLHIAPSVSFGSQALAGPDAIGQEASASLFDSPPSILRNQSMPAAAASASHAPVTARVVSVGVFVSVTVSRGSDATASEVDEDDTGTPPAIDQRADDTSSLSSFASSRSGSLSDFSDTDVDDNDVDESTGTPPQIGEDDDKQAGGRASSVSSWSSLSPLSALDDAQSVDGGDESVLPGSVQVGADYSFEEFNAIYRSCTGSNFPRERWDTNPSGQ